MICHEDDSTPQLTEMKPNDAFRSRRGVKQVTEMGAAGVYYEQTALVPSMYPHPHTGGLTYMLQTRLLAPGTETTEKSTRPKDSSSSSEIALALPARFALRVWDEWRLLEGSADLNLVTRLNCSWIALKQR